MKAVEASGKTREEAMQSALKELGVELYEVDKIEVLDEGSKGLFGFGARPVRVRLTVEHLEDDRGAGRQRGGRGPRSERGGERGERPQRPERGERGAQQQGQRGDRGPRPENRGGQPQGQRGGQQQREGRDGRDGRGGDRNRADRPQQGQQQGQRGGQQQREGRDGRGGQQGQRGDRGPRPERTERPQQPRPAAETAEGADASKPRHVNVHEEALDALRRAEQFEQFDSAAAPVQDMYDDTEAVEEAAAAGGEERPDEAFEPITEEQGQEAATLLRDMIAKMGIEAEVTFLHTADGAARLDVRSADSAMLIGRKGRTLGAMQYLVNRMIAQGDTAENTERLMVDVEGYVDRRRETLEDLARHFAGRVKESGRPARLKPLSPQERRIIHMTLRNDPDVRTASLGESLYRTVVISPINARPARSQGQNQGQGQGGQGGGRGRGSRGGRGGRGRGGRGRGGQGGQGGQNRQQEAEIDPGQFGD